MRCIPAGAAHQIAKRPSSWWFVITMRNARLPRTKNVGAPWLSRSLVSGRPRQISRMRSRTCSRSSAIRQSLQPFTDRARPRARARARASRPQEVPKRWMHRPNRDVRGGTVAPVEPIAETERLRLREFTRNDLDELAAMVADPEQMRFYP